jgi:hypothetical protein
VTLPCRLRDPRFGAAGDSIPLTERMPRTAVARVLALVALAAVVSTGCTSSHHKTAAEPATPVKRATPARTSPATAPAPAVAVPMCSAAQGILVPSAPPFTNADRLIQPFAYLNQGPPCFADGFPIVQLYDAEHQLLNIAEVDGTIVIGAAVPARYLLPTDNVTGGFNIETPTSGSCVTASYVSASFGGGSTPLAAVDYQVCGTVYLTPIFE